MKETRVHVKLGLAAENSEKEWKLLLNNNKFLLAPSVNRNQKEIEREKERNAAAALLLLFLSPPPPPPPPPPVSLSSSSPSSSSSSSSSSSTFSFFRNGELKEDKEAEEVAAALISISISETSTSSCISDACSSWATAAGHCVFSSETLLDQIPRNPLQSLALAAAANTRQASLRPKLQSVKKTRSKIQKRKREIKEIYKMRVVYDLLNSEGNKDHEEDEAFFSLPTTATTAATIYNSTTTTFSSAAASTLTAVTDTTMISSSLRPTPTKKGKNASSSSKTISTKVSSRASKSVKRRAEAIIDWLSGNGCSSEVKIRSVVGDSPDTSKALRLLLKKEEVKRTGGGGRSDPFLYTVALRRTRQS